MSKAEIDALGKVFANEVTRAIAEPRHNFPFQSKAAIFKRLVAGGLLEERTVVHTERPFRIEIRGYELTHAGRLLYCATCEGHEVEPAESLSSKARAR